MSHVWAIEFKQGYTFLPFFYKECTASFTRRKDARVFLKKYKYEHGWEAHSRDFHIHKYIREEK